MDDMKGMLNAINSLGEKINSLEADLRYAKYNNESLMEANQKLIVENDMMRSKLHDVQAYIDSMEISSMEE